MKFVLFLQRSLAPRALERGQSPASCHGAKVTDSIAWWVADARGRCCFYASASRAEVAELVRRIGAYVCCVRCFLLYSSCRRSLWLFVLKNHHHTQRQLVALQGPAPPSHKATCTSAAATRCSQSSRDHCCLCRAHLGGTHDCVFFAARETFPNRKRIFRPWVVGRTCQSGMSTLFFAAPARPLLCPRWPRADGSIVSHGAHLVQQEKI